MSYKAMAHIHSLNDYMAENWDKIKNLSRYDILEKFYEQLN